MNIEGVQLQYFKNLYAKMDILNTLSVCSTDLSLTSKLRTSLESQQLPNLYSKHQEGKVLAEIGI